LSLGTATVYAASSPGATPATSGGGDVPAAVRSTDEVKRQLNASSVGKTDIEILERARAANGDVYASLQSFVCNEEINRFKGNLNGQSAKPLDTVTAKLSFERGVEQYTDVQQNNHPKAGLSSLTGAWSEGEFGTLLLQTQQLLTTQQVVFESYAEVKGQPTAVYHFDVVSEDSPWDLAVSGRHYRLPFRTNVWISVDTGEILKIERATTSIPTETHISGIEWGISLEHVTLSGKTWLLPANGSYAVLYNESRHREWNQISFTGYQRYGAQTALKFE
jgi:hypothetical protein